VKNRDRAIARGGGLAVVLAFLAVWGGWFIHRTSFIANDGKRYYCLFDDAMISMTYARNLVEGYGLNWSKHGAPVEGFTHPLWTFLMIPVNLLPLPLEVRSLPIQILSLLLLGASAVAARRLVLRHFATESAPFGLPAAVLTAFYYPLSFWSLMGMETGFQALLALLAVHLALDVAEEGRERHVSLWLVCAAAYLLRMDMLPMAVAVQVYIFARRGVRPVLAARRWWLGLGLFLAVALGYSLFRWFYFHDVLPNTYYLKLTGVTLPVRVLKGLQVLSVFLQNQLPVLLPVGLATVPLMRRNPRLILPAALFTMYCAYSVYVGGDAWEDLVRENRYIAFVMPQLFVLLNAAVNQILETWSRLRRISNPVMFPAVATVAALLVVNGLVLSSKQEENWKNLLVTGRPPAVEGGWSVLDQLHGLQRRVAPGALVASAWAGIPAYFTDYRMIDVLGYNDRRIAHMHSQMDLDDNNYMLFRPGHNKFSLGLVLRRRPDAIFQFRAYGRADQLARRMTRAGYRWIDEFWLRKDSPKIHWPEGREPRAGGKNRRPKPAA
jgi:hypothetical protein